MSDESKKPTKKIDPPQKFPSAEKDRAVAKAGAGSIPVVGAAAAEVVDALMPNPQADDQDRWSGEITAGVNTLNDRVGDIDERTGERTVSLTGATALAAKYMIEKCPDGLRREYYSMPEMMEAYPDESKEDLLDGVGELEAYGLISSISSIGQADEYKLEEYGYEVLDEPIMGWNTQHDARQLAEMSLEYRDSVNVGELHEKCGWERRRFNPALRMVVNHVEPGRVSQAIQPEYVTRWFSPNNVERTILKRFAAGD